MGKVRLLEVAATPDNYDYAATHGEKRWLAAI